VVTYRAILDLPAEPVSFAGNVIATRRNEKRSPWRKPTSFDQAVLALVWLRDGDTFAQLGRHFGISTDTAWRHAHEAVDSPAGHAPEPSEALRTAGAARRPVLDGTLNPIHRRSTGPTGYTGTNQDPYHCGKHKRPGANLQALTDPCGTLAFLGRARCGSTHDLAAARADGIITAVTDAGIETLADTGYLGAGGTVRTPVKRRPGRGLKPFDRLANSVHAALRAPGERGFAQLKYWKVFQIVRVSPHRITSIAKAVLVLIQQRSSLAGVGLSRFSCVVVGGSRVSQGSVARRDHRCRRS